MGPPQAARNGAGRGAPATNIDVERRGAGRWGPRKRRATERGEGPPRLTSMLSAAARGMGPRKRGATERGEGPPRLNIDVERRGAGRWGPASGAQRSGAR